MHNDGTIAFAGAVLCLFIAGTLGLMHLARLERPDERHAGKFAVLALAVTGELLIMTMFRRASNDAELVFWNRMITAGFVLISLLAVEFSTRLARAAPAALAWAVRTATAFLFYASLGTDWVYRDAVFDFNRFGISRHAVLGPLYYPIVVFVAAELVGSYLLFARANLKRPGLTGGVLLPMRPLIIGTGVTAVTVLVIAVSNLAGFTSAYISFEMGSVTMIAGGAYWLVAFLISRHRELADRNEEVEFLTTELLRRNEEIERLSLERQKAMEEEIRVLREQVKHTVRFPSMIGPSPALKALTEQMARVAVTDANVLITGESGAGKELVAREPHRASGRASRPFVALNLAAIPVSLAESELLGYAKGAFTGANEAHAGYFLQADGGTIFLDEIGETPPGLQSKLLRVIQEKEVQPLGAGAPVHADVRIIAATNRDLSGEIAAGRFREDLFYRLNVVALRVPPLRERQEDIIPLFVHFLDRYGSGQSFRLDRDLLLALVNHRWPGNVRELQNLAERLVVLADGNRLGPDHLPEAMRSERHATTDLESFIPTLEELERNHIRQVMDHTGGNKKEAARRLGIDLSTLYRKLKGMEPPAA